MEWVRAMILGHRSKIGIRFMRANVVMVTQGRSQAPKLLSTMYLPIRHDAANALAANTWYRMMLAALRNVAKAVPAASTTHHSANPAIR